MPSSDQPCEVGNGPRLFFGFRKRYVQGLLAVAHAFAQELERECRLSRAWHPFNKVQPIRG